MKHVLLKDGSCLYCSKAAAPEVEECPKHPGQVISRPHPPAMMRDPDALNVIHSRIKELRAEREAALTRPAE